MAFSMKRLLRPLLAVLAVMLAAPLCTMLMPQEAKANVVCLIDNAAIGFGASNAASGAINFTCTNYRPQAQNFTLCVARGFSSWPGTSSQPAFPLPWPNKLNFNVYRDAAFSQMWTDSQPLTQSVSIPGGIGTTVSGSFQVYAQVASGQSPPPGNLVAAFYNTRLGFQSGGPNSCETWAAPYYSGQQFTLPLSATVSNDCEVSALGNADLGTVAPGSSPVYGSTAISVRCPTGTPYNIGLMPSNASSVGAGEMAGTGSNADTVPYQLHSNSNSGPIWGNTASVSGVGNGVSGTGDGTDQTYPVYVTTPDSDYTPDNYRDTVRVTVHY